MSKRKAAEWMGEVSVRRVPKGSHAARRYYAERTELIATGWLRRQQGLQTSSESAHTWFKRNMYRLLRAYVDAGQNQLLLEIARSSKRNQVGLGLIADNPFKLGLFAMWRDNEGMSRHQQRVFGNQMLYAYRHNVDPDDLGRFIRYAGSAQVIADRLSCGVLERGFGAAATG